MCRRLLVVLVVVAATGKLGRADPAARLPNRLGVDALGGIGIVEMLGGALRVESGATPASALTLRVGYLQARSVESETKELHPLYLVHGGYRRYTGWFYFAVEGGAIVWSTDDRSSGLPSAGLTIGAKLSAIGTELGLSLMGSPVGISLTAHIGLDLVTW